MSFQYWEYKKEQERLEALEKLQAVGTILPEVDVTPVSVAVAEEIVCQAIPEDIPTVSDDSETIEEKHIKSVARCIFVDGLLGLPFITIVLVLISALVAVFTIVTMVCGFAAVATLGGSVLSIAYAFISFGSAIETAFFILGFGLFLGFVSCLLIILTVLLGGRCVPFIASLYLKLVKKLHLFR